MQGTIGVIPNFVRMTTQVSKLPPYYAKVIVVPRLNTNPKFPLLAKAGPVPLSIFNERV